MESDLSDLNLIMADYPNLAEGARSDRVQSRFESEVGYHATVVQPGRDSRSRACTVPVRIRPVV